MATVGLIQKRSSPKIGLQKISKPQKRTEIGIGLALIGVPMGMYFNHLFPFIGWSPIFMALSVLLIMDYGNLLKFKFPSFCAMFFYIFLFQCLMLLYGAFSERLNSQFLSFHLYIIALIAGLSTQNKQYHKDLYVVCFFVSLITSFLGAFYIWDGMVTGEEAWLLKQENSNYALESFTIANGALTNLVCAIFLLDKKGWLKWLIWVAIGLDIYIVFMSGKRTPVFVAIIIVSLYLYRRGMMLPNMWARYLKIFFLIVLGSTLLYISNTAVETVVDKFFENFYNGVLNILGIDDVSDATGSAISRFNSRVWAYDYIEKEFNFFNILFGAGYMTRWLDNPLLQSYLDMGFLGLVLYSYLVLIFPLKQLFSTKNQLVLFAALLCLYNIVSTISSGHPYAYLKYVPVVFLIYMANLKIRPKPKFNTKFQ